MKLRTLRAGLFAVLLAAPAPVSAAGVWNDYEIVMWQSATAPQAAGLRALGFTAGKVFGSRDGIDPARLRRETAPLRQAGLRWYVENIATDFYAPYHRWQPDHPVTWLFDATRLRQRDDPADPAGYLRIPSLSDPAWLHAVAARLDAHVRAGAADRPLFYSLGDETGIADLAAFWDFDVSPDSLAGFRDWLRSEYGSLGELNRQWGSNFTDWSRVMQMSTDAALQAPDMNVSAWSDFKAWMDVAFARAVRAGTDAVHAADPSALAGIEGGQPQGWGGYDYTQLAFAVDVLEAYDRDGNIALAHTLNPALTLLTTSGGGPDESGWIWRSLLLGSRGLIVWDETGEVVGADGVPGPRGIALAPVLAELRHGIARRLIASHPVADPVAILVSPASFRLNWLLDRRADHVAWTARDSATEWDSGTADRIALSRTLTQMTHLGLHPDFLTPARLAAGALQSGGARALVLPASVALSDAEASAIRGFVAGGGRLVCAGTPGRFDGHGRPRAVPALDGVACRPLDDLAAALRDAGVRPAATLSDAQGRAVDDVDIRLFDDGAGARILALQGGAGRPASEVVITLPAPALVADLRHAGPASVTRTPHATLPADGPVLLELRTVAP